MKCETHPLLDIFQGCLGALDGTYASVHVPSKEKAKYRRRKDTIAVNVLGVCDHKMNFIYAFAGWEGSTADARVLRDALLRNDGLKVPRESILIIYGQWVILPKANWESQEK